MIERSAAAELLDFSVRIGSGQRAQEQLDGAVAIHNLLSSRKVAYLADEVGMGKTYVALGALALFRHFQPDFRVLIIAPRENIQLKWMKELRNFVAHNVRFPDLRVKGIDGSPCRPLVSCGNLLSFLGQATVGSNRDFFLRLTSFSLPVAGRGQLDPEQVRPLRDAVRGHLPWLRDEVLDLRNKQTFKDSIARALCCALPVFDLVIVDEGHNLKHGFGEQVSSRNRVLGLAMGHPEEGTDLRLFPGYGPRAKRVLFLSATPVEENYRQLWNQLDVFGMGEPYRGLLKAEIDEEAKKAVAGQFLIRRVTSVQVAGRDHTKNLYRREWRRGGVEQHDEPTRVNDPRQRLVVALVQKKVSELLGHEGFNASFQIGMLASFESFLETTRLKREDPEAGNFDDADQTDKAIEREGIDVVSVNQLAKSYRRKFAAEMPHPKMDALVASLAQSWEQGRKALVFVRRVASVKELKRKLDERYDQWLMARLRRELPETLHPRLGGLFERYRAEKEDLESRRNSQDQVPQGGEKKGGGDRGGTDTFFAWFFRGEGPRGVVSGANIQRRFTQRGTVYSTFFEDNHVAGILGCRPGEVTDRLTSVLQITVEQLRVGLCERSRRYLSQAQRPARADRFEAVQAAAVEWLKDVFGPYQGQARIVWHERFESSLQISYPSQAPDIGNWLELHTFFTEIRLRDVLRQRLWPVSPRGSKVQIFRDQVLRAQMLASAARLGHGLIDLYAMTIRRLGSLELRVQEAVDDEHTEREVSRITDYLDLLARQRETPLGQRPWGAFDELAEIGDNFDLIVDVNDPDSRTRSLAETARVFGDLLGEQQPVGGMSGSVSPTLVRQFRMPGYPLVLISTDLLQEGEDLHPFCSSVYHYGISWTPSSMEQRIGRIDRVRSQTDRRLSALSAEFLAGQDKLQVFFPHLEDTVEVLQVQRVLERMNIFLRLMHEGLTTAGSEEKTINTLKEFVQARREVPQFREPLKSAFPVQPEHLNGSKQQLEVGPALAAELERRFERLRQLQLSTLKVHWEPQLTPGKLLGTAQLEKRVQPFTLILMSEGKYPMVRCISPVGCVGPGNEQDRVVEKMAGASIKVGAILTKEERRYDLTVEGDVLLTADPGTDIPRVTQLVKRVVHQADLLEQDFLPGKDQPMAEFRQELVQEGSDER